MNRIEYPYTTVTEGITVFDRSNQYRPLQWLDASAEIDWINREDNGLLLTILDHLPSNGQTFNNPVVNWTEDTRMEVATTLASPMTVGDTYLNFVDPYIAVAYTYLANPGTSEVMEVVDVDYDKSEGWTTAGGATANVRVTRGMNGTGAVAGSVGDHLIAMAAYMAELSDPRGGVGRLPGNSQHNFISVVSATFQVSKMQDASMVYDNWGQVPKAAIDTVLDLRRQLSYALLFQARGTRQTADEGQIYFSQGALHYNQDGFLDLGNVAGRMTWPVFNDYAESRCDSDASSQEKTLLAGQNLFSTLLRLSRDIDHLEEGPYWDPVLTARAFRIRTDGGYMINVLHDRYGLNPSYGLGDWGFLLDMAHIEGAHYNGLEFQWFQNIQDNRSVMYREDAYLGSFSLIMKHQSTHGVIRGGAERIVER